MDAKLGVFLRKSNIFLSVAWPFMSRQEDFLNQIQQYFERKGYRLKKVQGQQNNQSSTIRGVLNLMEECEGMIVVAFKRMEIKEAVIRPRSDLDKASKYYRPSQRIQKKYKTSDWCNIEIGMAFGMNIPILIFLDECILKQDIYTDDEIQILNFDVDKKDYNLELSFPEEWQNKVKAWERKVQENE